MFQQQNRMGNELKFFKRYTEEDNKYKGALLKEDPRKLSWCSGLKRGSVDAGRLPAHQPDSAQAPGSLAHWALVLWQSLGNHLSFPGEEINTSFPYIYAYRSEILGILQFKNSRNQFLPAQILVFNSAKKTNKQTPHITK